MTREEAIEWVKAAMIDFARDDERSDEILTARDMAIKALSQEPCDDVISREDAEQMFRNIRSHLKPQDYKSAEEFNTRDLMLLNAEQMIHALPSVTQKSGKWIVYNYPAHECVYCSNCKTEYYEDDLYLGGSEFPKYCPNCGAKMESEEQE